MASARFDRRVRLTRPGEYRRVFENPLRSTYKGIVVLARENELGHPRLGLAIAKKHLKRAHERNRIKRLARESFRLHQAQMAPLDFVVMIRAGVDRLSNAEVLAILDKHWARLTRQWTEQ